MRATASAPGSSANLGPGFDVLAVAFEMRCRVAAEPSTTWSVTELGNTYQPTPDSLVAQATALAGPGPFALHVENDIPRARGLGSSAALTTAVAAAALRASGTEPKAEQVFEFVGDLEGHYDNAAAAVYGGCVAAFGGRWTQLAVDPNLVFIAAIPDAPLATAKARDALSASVDRGVAARSLGRIVFLVEGLRTGDPAVFAAAAGDEMHEAPRAELSPLTGSLIAAAYEGGALHAAWSGAGPTALAVSDADRVDQVSAAMAAALGDVGTVQQIAVSAEGWA